MHAPPILAMALFSAHGPPVPPPSLARPVMSIAVAVTVCPYAASISGVLGESRALRSASPAMHAAEITLSRAATWSVAIYVCGWVGCSPACPHF
jgi:hypothetical protein